MQKFRVKRQGHLLSTFNNEETPVDAPPKGSSDDEDEQDHQSSPVIERDDSPSGNVRTTRNKQKVRYEETVSSDENDLPRGSISKTSFSTQRAVRSQIEQNNSSLKPSTKVMARPDAEHLRQPAKPGASASRTYSSKYRKSHMAQERHKNKPKATREDVSPEAPTFKLPFEIISPQKSQDRGSGFVAPARSQHSSPLKATQFRNPVAGIDNSPSEPSTRATFKRPPKASDSDADSMSDSKRPKTAAASLRKSKRRSTEASADLSQPPAFKMPGIVGENAENFENFSDDDFTVKTPETSIHGLSAGPDQASVCPYCREPVEASSLQEFSNGAWMSLREKQTFCASHKKASAKKSWETRGYPRIDWDKLDDRLGRHDAHLQNILSGEKSYFGDKLLEHIKSGEERTLFKSKHIVGPGYYGPRGMRMLQEHIIRVHSSLLRQRAVEDRVVAARGYGHYVQAVLVPELATRLIIEDMNVSPEDARKILVESVKVGELLNEDTADAAATQADESE